MNYFAHGRLYLDRPYFLAGTAIPDWLSVVDRKVRMRSNRVEPFADGSSTIEAELAAGVLQHLQDDQWFHDSRAFIETSSELTRLFRDLLGPEDGFRPGFLGHIVTELLLDAVLIEQNPRLLDDYYTVLRELDHARIEATVNRMSKFSTDRLAEFIPLFVESRFLFDYLEPKALLFRLNQVMRRIKLKQLPDRTCRVLAAGREIVEQRAGELLPCAVEVSSGGQSS
jgi:hypothetical protein